MRTNCLRCRRILSINIPKCLNVYVVNFVVLCTLGINVSADHHTLQPYHVTRTCGDELQNVFCSNLYDKRVSNPHGFKTNRKYLLSIPLAHTDFWKAASSHVASNQETRRHFTASSFKPAVIYGRYVSAKEHSHKTRHLYHIQESFWKSHQNRVHWIVHSSRKCNNSAACEKAVESAIKYLLVDISLLYTDVVETLSVASLPFGATLLRIYLRGKSRLLGRGGSASDGENTYKAFCEEDCACKKYDEPLITECLTALVPCVQLQVIDNHTDLEHSDLGKFFFEVYMKTGGTLYHGKFPDSLLFFMLPLVPAYDHCIEAYTETLCSYLIPILKLYLERLREELSDAFSTDFATTLGGTDEFSGITSKLLRKYGLKFKNMVLNEMSGFPLCDCASSRDIITEEGSRLNSEMKHYVEARRKEGTILNEVNQLALRSERKKLLKQNLLIVIARILPLLVNFLLRTQRLVVAFNEAEQRDLQLPKFPLF